MSDPLLTSILSVSQERFHRIAYADWGRDGDRGTVICVHGLTRQGRDFDYLARELAARGKRVMCPDIVGRGRSGRLKHPNDYGLPQYVTDMALVMASSGAREVDYVGTSLGGLIGILLAGREGTPIRRLVINDVGPRVETRAAMRIGEYVTKAPSVFPTMADVLGYYRSVLRPFGDLSDEHWHHLAEHSVRQEPEGHWVFRFDRYITWGFRGPWHDAPELWRAWDKIKCPILLLRGETSDLLSVATVRDMIIRNPRTEVVEIPGCGHAPALLDAVQVGLVADWLTETEPGPGEAEPASVEVA